MSEQTLDLHRALSIVRRQRRTIAAVTALGALGGVLLVQVHPPQYSSTTKVLLPAQSAQAGGQSGQDAGRDMDTELQIAISDVVLVPASRAVSPPLSLEETRDRVTVTAGAGDVLKFEATGRSASAAEALAVAVADAEVAYQDNASSSLSQIQLAALEERRADLQRQLETVAQEIQRTRARLEGAPPDTERSKNDASTLAQLTAQQSDLVLQDSALQDRLDASRTGSASVIESATPATRPLAWVYYGLWALAGALMGFLLAAGVAIAFGRRDRRLRTRDEIADALGSPVLASVRGRSPRDAAGWSSLLEGYTPDAVDTWAWRQALDTLGLAEVLSARATATGKVRPPTRFLTVVSLSDDPRGLALGTQLASHLSSLGVETAVTAFQRHDSADACWTALSSYPAGEKIRPRLRVEWRRRRLADVDVVVRIAVIDRREPALPVMEGQPAAVLALASASATAEDLARAAVAVFESGGRIHGIFVADPDPLDRTTGRLVGAERSRQVPLPYRLTGLEGRTGQRGAPGGGGEPS